MWQRFDAAEDTATSANAASTTIGAPLRSHARICRAHRQQPSPGCQRDPRRISRCVALRREAGSDRSYKPGRSGATIDRKLAIKHANATRTGSAGSGGATSSAVPRALLANQWRKRARTFVTEMRGPRAGGRAARLSSERRHLFFVALDWLLSCSFTGISRPHPLLCTAHNVRYVKPLTQGGRRSLRVPHRRQSNRRYPCLAEPTGRAEIASELADRPSQRKTSRPPILMLHTHHPASTPHLL